MLAVRLERDALEQHDIVVAADLLEGAIEMVRGILAVTAAIFLPCARDALGGVEQAFAGRIVARPADQRLDRLRDIVGDGDLGGRGDEVAVFGGLRHAPCYRVAPPGWQARLGAGRRGIDQAKSLAAVSATSLPWKRAPSRSTGVGWREPSPAAIVVMP